MPEYLVRYRRSNPRAKWSDRDTETTLFAPCVHEAEDAFFEQHPGDRLVLIARLAPKSDEGGTIGEKRNGKRAMRREFKHGVA